MRPLLDRLTNIRCGVLHPALSRTLPVPREHNLLHPRSHHEATALVHDDLLLLCLPWGGKEQRVASLHQVPSHDGDAS